MSDIFAKMRLVDMGAEGVRQWLLVLPLGPLELPLCRPGFDPFDLSGPVSEIRCIPLSSRPFAYLCAVPGWARSGEGEQRFICAVLARLASSHAGCRCNHQNLNPAVLLFYEDPDGRFFLP